VAEKSLGLMGEKRAKALRRFVAWAIPEWQVFIRRANGTHEHFTITRKHQLILVAGISAVGVWAGMASMLLGQQPDELAAKERHLEEMMAATRAAQHRLAASQKVVSEVAREVDTVHANVLALAESNSVLAKDKMAVRAVPPAKTRSRVEPQWNDDGQPGSEDAKAVREQVRRLESSLDRLRGAYGQAVQNTAEVAGSRISEAEKALQRLGLDPEKLIQRLSRDSGRGGPFVPMAISLTDGGLTDLLSRMDRWSGVKAAMGRLPLAEPIRQAYDVNSGFGARNDPINRRTGIHEGVDFGAPYGAQVYSTGEGVVTFAGPWDRYGLTVDVDHGGGVVTRYAHLSRIKAKVGQKVTRSSVLGLLGNTGRSTGAHLHYEVRVADSARDPLKFISVGRDAPKTR
jgi:murein DD-endopeptidase MepM/ murein hydrolase activator NlpD